MSLELPTTIPAVTTSESTEGVSASEAADRRQVRVTHLVSGLDIGGLEKVVLDLTRLADRNRFDVSVLCLGAGGALRKDFTEAGIQVHDLDVLGSGTRKAILALGNELRIRRPDVLHTHNPAPHLIGAMAARWARVPVVVNTKHGRNYPERRRKVWANRVATCFSDRVVAVSDDAASVATQIERVAAKKVQRIWNGIQLADFPPIGCDEQRSPLHAIHVARLIYPTKDQKSLLHAVRLVVDRQPDFRMTIVGDGPHRGMLTGLRDHLNLQQHVEFVGYRRDIRTQLSRAGQFVLSSVKEGLSITLLEAAASGLPIVATDVGGNGEVVMDQHNGILVPPRAPRELADAMLRLIDQPDWARRLGRQGRQRIEDHFDLQTTVDQYEQLYFQLLAAKGATP